MLGLDPAGVTNCRVLELGCAVGGNIIPMAYALPDSEFVGVDYAPQQIETGRATIADMGLTNIRLETADIREIKADFGQFDYIIAHGVYSWVPAPVRDALLAVCRQNLAPQGVAYISYNTYPGWHMLGAIREMMLYHTRNEPHGLSQVQKARQFLDFLVESIPAPEEKFGSFLGSYAAWLEEHVEKTEERTDALMLHDELEIVNDPVYFHEFNAHAGRHGLQYLAEAEFPTVMPTNFAPETAKRLYQMSRSIIEVEQYMDFLRNRTFRQTLLCRHEVPVVRSMQPDPRKMASFYISSRAVPVSKRPDIHGDRIEAFRAPDDAKLSTDHPVSKAALAHLAKISPAAIPFLDLLREAWAVIYADTDPLPEKRGEDATVLAANLLRGFAYSMNLIELRRHRPPITVEVSDRPVASLYARYQVNQGVEKITNLRHERVNLDPLTRQLIPFLDGAHGREALIDHFLTLAAEGRIGVEIEGEAITDPAESRRIMAREIDKSLTWLARTALLVE